MEKTKVKVLVVDRALKEGEHAVKNIFFPYKVKDYDIVIFPFREDKPYTEVVVLKISIKSSFEWGELFQISVDGDEDDPFFSFELEGIEEEVFYEILSQEFEVESSNLTTVEKIS